MLVSYKVIGRNIRQARAKAGLTQEQTAERLKISQLHFGRLERGERPVSLEHLARIAKVLGVPTASLLTGCTLEEVFATPADESTAACASAFAHLAGSCSPKARKLMLTVCREIAESDRTTDDEMP